MHHTGNPAIRARGVHVRYVYDGESAGDEQRRERRTKWHTAQHICNRFPGLRAIRGALC